MKSIVRVLLVTDDGGKNGGYLPWRDQPMPAAVGDDSREFHLGEFVRVLQNTAWLGFDVELTKAHRTQPSAAGMTEAALKADRGADAVGFRFDASFSVNGESRTLADYDMALFFAIDNGNPDTSLAPEAEAIAQFMESGGGFFATGDHANLGSKLCGLIPRVRSMRRWWGGAPGPNGEPQAPSPSGANRHDTTRPGPDNIGQFEDQSDEVAQEITLTHYRAGFSIKQGYPAIRYLPHPLLCSPDGPVRWLPDHMHEGWCEVPGNLAARTFSLAAASVREYPDYTPPNSPAGFVPAPLAPELAAFAQVLSGIKTPAMDEDAHTGSPDAATGKSFGVIGAWDGHRVGKGRVVVDATWHHFFDINLTGDRYLEDESLTAAHQQKLHGFYVPDGMGGRVPNAQYKMIMWYYRNIVYWLIPAKRRRRVWWDTLVAIAKRPQVWEELGATVEERTVKRLRFEDYIYFGQLAEEYLDKARGACACYLVHEILYKPKIPWWEWIQEQVNVWDPVVDTRVRDELRREQLIGALGAGPRPEVAATLSLGAAMVAVASIRRELDAEADEARALRTVQTAFESVFDHATSELGKRLSAGAEVQRKLGKLIPAQAGAKEAR